jgi:hypothetical protein
MRSMPVSAKLSCRRVETSESRKGNNISPASIRLTEQPSKAMMQAYSQPIGPAPTTARLFGM